MTTVQIPGNEHAIIREAIGLLGRHAGEVRRGALLDGAFARWAV